MYRAMANIFDPDNFIVRAEVQILGIEPRIVRTLELPKTLNMAGFHEVLQAAFGWTDSHLHQFIIGGVVYGAPEFDEDGLADHRTFEATELRMVDFVFPHYPEEQVITIRYEYDFGDNWRHQIRMEEHPREEGVTYPRCIAASRSGPPEDVGGPYGYADFLEAWRDPAHDEHKAVRRWVGRKFDPEACDLVAINRAIAKAVRLSRGDYRFRQRNKRQ